MCNTVYIDKSHMCNVKWKKPNTERIYTVYTLYDLLKFKHSEKSTSDIKNQKRGCLWRGSD